VVFVEASVSSTLARYLVETYCQAGGISLLQLVPGMNLVAARSNSTALTCTTDIIPCSSMYPLMEEPMHDHSVWPRVSWSGEAGDGAGVIACVPPPGLPTLAECEYFRRLGCSSLCASNLAPFISGRVMGCNAAVLLLDVSSPHRAASQAVEEQDWASHLLSCWPQIASRILAWQFTSPGQLLPVAFRLQEPVPRHILQGTPSLYQAAAEMIERTMAAGGSKLESAIFTMHSVRELSSLLHRPESGALHMGRDFPSSPFHHGHVYPITLPSGERSLCVSSMLATFCSGISSDCGYFVRVCAALGIKRLLFLIPSRSTAANSPPKKICLVKDHVNFTGRNPLFGLNHEGFGTRFPDISHCYKVASPALQSRLAAYHGAAEYVLYIPGPCYMDEGWQLAAKAYGCNIVSNVGASEVVVAAHAGMDSVTFAIDVAQADASVSTELNEIISQFVKC